jgi:ATP-dependent DNA helicase RecG
LAVLRAQPQASRKDIAAQMGDLTEDGVKYQLAKLKAKGWIRRIGSDRGGYWEVLHDE